MKVPIAITITMLFGVALLVGVVLFVKRGALDTNFENIVTILYRQCARWAVAAEQDENAVIGVLHANYATGYLWALKDIVRTDIFKKITGEDFLTFENKVVKIQDTATQKLVSVCKESIPISDPSLLKAIYKQYTV